VAGLFDKNTVIINGEKFGTKLEAQKNSITVTDSYSVSANTGKSASTLTINDAVNYTTSEGGIKITETSSIKATEGKSTLATDILKKADFELVLAETGKSTSVGTSVWKTGDVKEYENGKSTYSVSALNAQAGASSKATIGSEGVTAKVTAGASVSVFEASGSVEYGALKAKGEVSVLKAEANASAGFKAGPDGVELSAKVGASVTVAEMSGSIKAGDGNLGIGLGADAKFLSASADAGVKVGYAKNEKTGEYELNAFFSAEANAVLAEGSVSADFSLAGVDFGAKAGVYIGAGARVKIGVTDGKFVFDISAALGIGFSLKFTIGFNNEFLKNIKSILSYPGNHCANNNPHIKADPAKLREYASRLNAVNSRLSRLDTSLRFAFREVSPWDMLKFAWINLLTSGSPTLRQVISYLENTASRFEAADKTAGSNMGG